MKKTLLPHTFICLFLLASCANHPTMPVQPTTVAMTEKEENREPASSHVDPGFLEAEAIFNRSAAVSPAFIKSHANNNCVVFSKSKGPIENRGVNFQDRGNAIYEDFADESICRIVACIGYHSQFFAYKKGYGLYSTSPYKSFTFASGTKENDNKTEFRIDGDSFIGQVKFNVGFINPKYEAREYLRCSAY